MGSAFSSGNSIYVRTEHPAYYGGDVVNATAFLNAVAPIKSKGIYVKICGYEKIHWQEQRQTTVSNGSSTSTVTYYVHYNAKKAFFSVKIPLFTFAHAEILPGQYAFPFTFVLPPNLPGSFSLSGGDYSCSVVYEIKSECHVEGFLKSNVKHKQSVPVFERFNMEVVPTAVRKMQKINVCCCIPRGVATVNVRTDKNCYNPGNPVDVICEVDNQSKMDFRRLKCRLLRIITLRDGRGSTHTVSNVLVETLYDGVPKMSRAVEESARHLALTLKRANGGQISPDTRGSLITCAYFIEVSGDIAMAFDMKTRVPIRICAKPRTAEDWNACVAVPQNWAPQTMPLVSVTIPVDQAPALKSSDGKGPKMERKEVEMDECHPDGHPTTNQSTSAGPSSSVHPPTAVFTAEPNL